jgi:hypothetical protein
MRFSSEAQELGPLRASLEELLVNAPHLTSEEIKLQFKAILPEYLPYIGPN